MILEFKNCFLIENEAEIAASEKFSSFDIEYKSNPKVFEVNESFLSLISKIGENDVWFLKYQIQGFQPRYLRNTDKTDIEKFNSECINDFSLVDDEDECRLSLSITKNESSNRCVIYNEDKFFEFIDKIDFITFLDLLTIKLTQFNHFNFAPFESSNIEFSTRSISYNKTADNDGFIKPNLSGFVYFNNYGEYPFSPLDFHVTPPKKLSNSLVAKLESLELVFCLTSIFDITSLDKENGLSLNYKLNGYRSFDGSISVQNLPLDSRINYFRIFEWVYAEPSKIIDKLGLARNVLSLFLETGKLDISDKVYTSIQSAYKTYLKENLSRYIEVRGKIKDQLSGLTQKANSVTETYISGFQRSIFAFISFFVSIFVIRVLIKGDFENVFTRDATILSLGLLSLSVIYLIYSRILINKEKSRLLVRYGNLKKGFEDLLLAEDIERILDNDLQFNTEVEFIDRKVRMTTLLWVSSITALLVTIIILSNCLSWQPLFRWLH